mgnify:CR=1 FL=1
MDVEKIKTLVEFDTPTVANGLGLLGVRDDSYGYTGPDIRALTPDFGARVGIGPGTVDVTLLAKKFGVLEFHGDLLMCREWENRRRIIVI